MDKVWHVDEMDYFSTFKEKEILKHAELWMNFKEIS